jgi:predicted RNA-binding Zn-ribbon protein involved in translation (DUF1610 family)
MVPPKFVLVNLYQMESEEKEEPVYTCDNCGNTQKLYIENNKYPLKFVGGLLAQRMSVDIYMCSTCGSLRIVKAGFR